MRPQPCLRAVLLLAATLAGNASHAACESGLAERMQSRLYPTRTLDHSLAACRAWPAYVDRSIVVLPLHADGSARLAGQRTLDLVVLVIQRPDNGNTERDAVIAQRYQADALREHGPVLQELRIDTARYLLAPGQRAFGLRARYRGDELAAPFAAETLRLYLPQGVQIQQILAETEVERDSGRWDLQCEGQFERLRTQITTQPVAGRRWADLLLSRTLLVSRSRRQADGQCVDQAAPARHTPVRLRHDGEGYAAPASLRSPL